MRGALVLFEGLPPTVIDSQVLAHVRLAREALGIDLAVVAVACSPALYESSRNRIAGAREASGGEVRLIRGVRPALPGSLFVNRRLLGAALSALGPLAFIHARADYAAAVCGPWGRDRGIPVLWDCRGDSRAELRERLGASVASRYRSALLERELRIAGASPTGALFVTQQLRDAMARYRRGQPSWIVPCLAPEAGFFFDPALRDRVRVELGLASDEAVYVYSGSLVAYQRFDETVAHVRAMLASGQRARLIVLTPEIARARQACSGLPSGSVICESVAHSLVNGYLNAADFGMLLRDSTPVNHVAFPTKFAEYAMTGLSIVMKEAPPACVAAARELGNYLPLGAPGAASSAEERKRVAALAALRLGRRAAMPAYAEIYRTVAAARP